MKKQTIHEIETTLKKMVLDKGYPVYMDSTVCVNHKKIHSNCVGCESVKGCLKYTKLMMVFSTGLLAKHDTPEEITHNSKWVIEEFKKILEV